MFNLKMYQRQVAQVRLPDPNQLWWEILEIALTSNTYPDDFLSEVLPAVRSRDAKLVMRIADAMSQQQYETPMLHYRMHQFAALVRKYPLPPEATGFDPEATAKATFLAAEHRCKRVNQRFAARRKTGRGPYNRELEIARNWIKYVLGGRKTSEGVDYTPPYSVIYQKCDITTGAAIGVHGNATNLARKLSSESWSVSYSALPYALGALWSHDQIRELILSNNEGKPACIDKELFVERVTKRVAIYGYNNISFVPKTAKTYRSIAVEPFLNTYLQNGVDTFLRERLRRVGLDLRNQQLNCEMARQGSFDTENGYCTIDLSSASDTMAREVVHELLPYVWVDFLEDLRSTHYKMDETVRKYHKFTSMGNGFCFPLQTMLFASICHAAYVDAGLRPDFRVYGDDIIVRKSVFPKVIELLDYLGFIPNTRKTFNTGPFRESCGADWHGGVNVRPIYLDHELDSLSHIFGLYNQSLRREYYVQLYFEEIRRFLWKKTPKSLRFVSLHDPSYSSDLPTSWEGTTIDGAFWVPQDVFLVSPHVEWDKELMAWRAICLRVSAVSDPDFPPQRGTPASLVYHIGGLRGVSSDKPFTLRYTARTTAAITY